MSSTRAPYPEHPIKRQKGKANNMPGSLAKKMYWDHPVLAYAKMVGWLYVDHRAGSEGQAVAGGWASLGISRKGMLEHVRRIVPSFDEVWAECHPRWPDAPDSEKANQLYNRVYHMYTQVIRGRRFRMVSCEHPLRSRFLRPHCETARRMYAADKPVSRAKLTEMFDRDKIRD